MKTIEYSEVSRQKITDLRQYLTEEFGDKTSKKIVRKLLDTIDNLSLNEKMGVSVADALGIDSDYRYLVAVHNYVFYRIEESSIVIVNIFNDREDFMYQLFGIKTISDDTIDYWGE